MADSKPLHQVLEESCNRGWTIPQDVDDAAVARLGRDPGAAKGKDMFGCTALHYAVQRHPSRGLVAALLRAHPGQITEPNNYKQLPLHCAAMYKADAGVIEMLVAAFPDGVNAKDDDGDTPLRWAMINGNTLQRAMMRSGASAGAESILKVRAHTHNLHLSFSSLSFSLSFLALSLSSHPLSPTGPTPHTQSPLYFPLRLCGGLGGVLPPPPPPPSPSFFSSLPFAHASLSFFFFRGSLFSLFRPLSFPLSRPWVPSRARSLLPIHPRARSLAPPDPPSSLLPLPIHVCVCACVCACACVCLGSPPRSLPPSLRLPLRRAPIPDHR